MKRRVIIKFDDKAVLTRKVVLEKIQSFSRMWLTDDFLANTEVDCSVLKEYAREYCLEMRSYFYGESLGEVLLKYPENWKESLKERFFPKWLLKRYPVKYKEFTLKQTAVYPNIKNPSLPNKHCIIQNEIKNIK